MKYTKEHEWIKLDGENALVGITKYAAEALGTLVFVELPKVGSKFAINDACAVVESTKSASDVYMPVSGEIVSTNESLLNSPEIINHAEDGDAFLFKIKLSNPSELDSLLSQEEYAKIISE